MVWFMLNLGRGREGGCHKAGRKGETGPGRLAAAFATDPQRGAMDHRGGMEGQSEGEVSLVLRVSLVASARSAAPGCSAQFGPYPKASRDEPQKTGSLNCGLIYSLTV